MLDLYSTKDRGVGVSKTTWPVNSSQELKSLSTEQRSERRWRVERHGDIKVSKQSGSFLSPVKVRRNGKRRSRESTSKYSSADMKSITDNDGRRIKNHFELKKDNGKRLFGANEERLAAKEKGTRRDNQKEGLPGLELGSTDQKAKTIHEVTSEKHCKLPPLKSTRKSGTDLSAMHATEEASTSSEDTSEREEPEIQKPTSISTAGLYDLNELQKKLKLKQENQEGILKLKQDGDGEPSDGNISTHREEITVEKNGKKVRFEPEANESDVKCTVKTVTFPLQLVKLGQQSPILRKGEKNAVVFPRIADRNSHGLYGTLMGSRENCNSLAYFRLDHGGSLRRRMKPQKQTDGKSATVECRGQACFPGFVSLPSLEKVADWLTR